MTASGVIVGMLGLDSIIDGHARAAILWLVVALLLDGVDGPIRASSRCANASRP